MRRGPRGRSRLLGIHLEGPFISAIRKGAHDPGLIRPPDPAELAALQEASAGRLRLLTAAPELAGFGELAAAATAAGVLITAGHTDARGPEFLRAIAAGTRSLTHTFNGMRPVTHRDPGVLEPIVDSDVFCELICDGVHVSPVFVRLLRLLAGRDRLILITDAVAWAGLPEGEYRSGNRHVEIRDRGVRLAGTDTLAGSTLTMGEAVARYARYTGAGLEELARVASTNAARLLGEDHRIGRIRPGHNADLVVVDATRAPAGVMRAGRWIRRPGEPAAAPSGAWRRSPAWPRARAPVPKETPGADPARPGQPGGPSRRGLTAAMAAFRAAPDCGRRSRALRVPAAAAVHR